MDRWALLASIVISFGASFIFAFILYWFDLYEKEPLLLLGGVFFWGAIVAAGAAFLINTIAGISLYLLTGSEFTTGLASAALVAPVIEEILKGFAVLMVFWVFKHEFDSVLDGIVFAGVAALGFAATENAYYIYIYGFLEEGWEGIRRLALIRLGLVGWQHPFYTAFFGISLAIARLNRSKFLSFVAPIVGMLAAIAAHGLHNLLASVLSSSFGMILTTALDWFGWILMLIFIFIIMLIERRNLINTMRSEVDSRTLTQNQFKSATSLPNIFITRFKAFLFRKYRPENRFYHNVAELALKKNLLNRLGPSEENILAVATMRSKVMEGSRSM